MGSKTDYMVITINQEARDLIFDKIRELKEDDSLIFIKEEFEGKSFHFGEVYVFSIDYFLDGNFEEWYLEQDFIDTTILRELDYEFHPRVLVKTKKPTKNELKNQIRYDMVKNRYINTSNLVVNEIDRILNERFRL